METNAAEKRRVVVEGDRLVRGPMTEAELRFLRDVQAFIDFSIRNGRGFLPVLSQLGHDVNNIVLNFGGSYDEAIARGFAPKVSGYSEITPDSVGEPAEAVE